MNRTYSSRNFIADASFFQVYTSAYDCTIRSLSFETSISREIFHAPDSLITSVDLPVSGYEMWVSDSLGGITHLDLREDKTAARPRWYGLSDQKIGCVSVNPREPHFLLTASNSKMLRSVFKYGFLFEGLQLKVP